METWSQSKVNPWTHFSKDIKLFNWFLWKKVVTTVKISLTQCMSTLFYCASLKLIEYGENWIPVLTFAPDSL